MINLMILIRAGLNENQLRVGVRWLPILKVIIELVDSKTSQVAQKDESGADLALLCLG
jgi:hypothetical protein